MRVRMSQGCRHKGIVSIYVHSLITHASISILVSDFCIKLQTLRAGGINVYRVTWEMANSRSQPWTPNGLDAEILDGPMITLEDPG